MTMLSPNVLATLHRDVISNKIKRRITLADGFLPTPTM